jgi:integrase/recombinase XerD
LDSWRSAWSPDARDKDNRLALTTQAALLTRIKAFFSWSVALDHVKKDPAARLPAITTEDSQTWPLTPSQFDELLKATNRLDQEARYKASAVGQHLRAAFLVQRWTGLRIGDVLMLPKTALQGNRLTSAIQKKKNRKPKSAVMTFIVPTQVVEALNSLPKNDSIHAAYFFWSGKGKPHTNTNKWLRKIDRLNEYLDFEDEQNEPLPFRSHMLRDTFAVEMLLAGMPLEKVSKLLGHESVTMTERYYAKWTKARDSTRR